MAVQIASLYAKVGGDTSGLQKALQEASVALGTASKEMQALGENAGAGSEGTKKQTASLKDLGIMVAKVTAPVVAFGIAAKKAFDFSESGAAVIQTAISFDRLGVSIEDLRTASRGTISDVELMASTLTLTAGASEELQAKMLDAAPQLLEIAKAANAVNPSLGDTAFMFDSLARGIKRSAPVIIDNTGLILKLGAANEAYAESLGKTVEELTAEEKQIALLNATLEAGNRLIEQAGGSTAAYGDAWAAVRAGIKNTTDAMKENAAEGLLPLVQYMADYLDAARKIEELDFDKGYTETAKWENLAEAQKAAADSVGRDAEAIAKGMAAMNQGFSDVGASAPPAAVSVAGLAAGFDQYNGAIAGAEPSKIQTMIDQMWETSEAAGTAAIANMNFAASIGEMSKAAFAQAAIEIMAESMRKAGKGATEIAEGTRAVLVEFGLLTPAEEEASRALGTFAQKLADDQIKLDGYASGVGDIYGIMDKLEDKEVDITINTHYNTYGDPAASGGAGGYVDPGTGSGFSGSIMNAAGGDYIVSQPASFTAGEAGTERVIVIPQGRPGFGGTGGGMGGGASKIEINVHGTNDPEAAANLVIRKLADRGIVAAGGGLR